MTHQQTSALFYTPFETAESAWFWFVEAYNIAQSGATLRRSAGSVQRPCEPVDIINIVARLFKQHQLTKNHLRVLTNYGQQQIRPDPINPKQQRDFQLWAQAMRRLEPIFIRKGITTDA